MGSERWKRIEELFQRVADLPAEERGRVLKEESGGDSALQREVEALIESRSTTLFDAPAIDRVARDLAGDEGRLTEGRQLGSYRVVSLIGRGGMGEVYRAQDVTLGREVALKVLPASFAFDLDRVARFDREARLLATLNHPNIATIHGLEEHDGRKLLVLELIEGETLADRLERGPIPVQEALSLALQIAQALEAAHEEGVVHRDLKPANIKIARGGQVKVLDFGLGKAQAHAPVDVKLSDSPTLSLHATQPGVILGTPGYMSPEQARGEVADHRADVWAFGVVLFEMLTGRTAFGGRTAPDALAEVLAKDPPWERLPDKLHPRVLQLLQRCLAKDPKDRYAGISDARVDIATVLQDPGRGMIERAARTREGPSWAVLPWVVAVAVLAAVLIWFMRPVPEAQPVVTRFPILLPEDQVLTQLAVSGVAVSRDGTRVAYVANNQIYLREMNDEVSRPLPGTAGTDISAPVFSPDGESIAFYALRSLEDATLMRVPIAGGTPRRLWEGSAPLSVSWPTDDTILFVTIEGDAVRQIPASGGDDQVLLAARDGERLESPHLLPDGTHILFTSGGPGGWDAATIYIQAIDGGERTLVWEGGSDAMWLPTGHIVYANGNELFAIPWDLDRMEPVGRVVPVLTGVQRSVNSDAAQVAVSDNGTLVYLPGSSATAASNEPRRSSLVWVDDGRETPVPIPSNEFRMARISPDQRRVALVVGLPGDIYVYDLETGSGGQRTFDPGADDTYPVWTGNDEFLFASVSSDRPGIYSMAAAGGEAAFVGTAGSPSNTSLPESLSPDGQTLLVSEVASSSVSNVAALGLAGPAELRTLIPGAPASAEPVVAPNGEWLAYTERRSDDGTSQIVLRPYPDVQRTRVTIPALAGVQKHPLLLEDQLLFLIRDQGIYSVDVTLEPELVVGSTPRRVVSGLYWYGTDPFDGGGRAWDVDRDGRFLMIRLDEGVGSSAEGGNAARLGRLNVVENWFSELEEIALIR